MGGAQRFNLSATLKAPRRFFLLNVALCLLLALNVDVTLGQSSSSTTFSGPPLQVNGIFPSLAVTASSGPKRSECGIGALMPWVDKLYMVSYLSTPGNGYGTGFYAIHANLSMETLVLHNSTYANRLVHPQTSRIVIGAWTVDLDGKIQTFEDLLHVRITATAEHLTHPATMVYMVGMDGPVWECDLISMGCTQIFDLVKELNIPVDQGEQVHVKGGHTNNGRLVVASNTFEEADFMGTQHGGRLAEWEGPGHEWKILEKTAFVEVAGRKNFGRAIYALGWDYRSVILKVYDGRNPEYHYWQKYRLPKGSHAYDHLWQTEWPRIREVETERYLMDMHGLFYELSPLGWGGSTWGIRPISQHLRMVPDFASFRGFLVMGGNQVSEMFDNNLVTGQAQSGLWFGKTDDLWSFGKPQGWGAVWRNDTINGSATSDPYLMTGFDKKVLHVILHSPQTEGVTASFVLEADVTGAAGHRGLEQWVPVKKFELSDTFYYYFTFPTGYSAHWVRLTAACTDKHRRKPINCTLTAYFHYT